MPVRGRNEGGAGCSRDAAPRAAPAARSGKTFDVEGQKITSEADDPWELIGKGEHIYLLGNWWTKPPASQKKALEEWITNANAQWKCELVGYVEEWTFGDGEETPAYIIEEVTEHSCYAIRVNDVRRRLPRRLQPAEVESDDEEIDADAEADPPAARGGGRRGNIATHQADTHYRLVIETYGDAEQKLKVNGSHRNWYKMNKYGKVEGRTGGQRADELRWDLLESMSEIAQFGSVGDPQKQNMRRGAPVLITPAKPTAADPGPSGAASDGQYRVTRWQGDEHAIARPKIAGKCALVDCPFSRGDRFARMGCRCCGKRFCGFTCFNRHVNEHGVKYIRQNQTVEFQPDSDEEG